MRFDLHADLERLVATFEEPVLRNGVLRVPLSTWSVLRDAYGSATGRTVHNSIDASFGFRDGLIAEHTKFITHNNVAVTNLTVTNTGSASATVPLRETAPPVIELDAPDICPLGPGSAYVSPVR